MMAAGFMMIVIALLGVAFVGGIIALMIFLSRRSERHAERLANELRMRRDGRRHPRAFSGERSGVAVSFVHTSEGSGDSRQSVTYVTAAIEPPLRLGLRMSAQGAASRFFSDLLGSRDVEVGDPEFDREFRTHAVQAGELSRFFHHPDFRRTLLMARRQYPGLSVSDSVVRIRFSGHLKSAHRLEPALQWVAALSSNAQHARKLLGLTATERELAAAWRGFAGVEGFQFDEQALVLVGKSGRNHVQVVPVIERGHWRCRFRAEFSRPLSLDLSLKRQGLLSGISRFFGMQDIAIGDAAFDDAFVIQGRPEEDVRRVFAEAETRQAILDLLSSAEQFEVHDDHLYAVAVGLVNTEASIRASIAAVANAADRICGVLDAPSVGAYR